MSAYEYSALDAKGRQVKGLIEGDTQRQVRQSLRDRGLTPLEIREVAEKTVKAAAAGGFSMNRGGSFNSTELSLFTRQIATLIRSGLPLDEALAAVSQQSESKRVQRVTLGVRSRVTEGNSLAKALGDFPGAFPPLFRATIEAGESAGKLDSVLERLADYAERSQAIRSKVMLATFYPAILTFVAIGVIALLMSFVVPKVVGVFDSIGADLPPLTKGLIATSAFLQAYGMAIFIALVLGFFVFKRALKNDGFRRKYHFWVLRLPLIGRLVRGANTGRFMRTLGILFGSGVPILGVAENMSFLEGADGSRQYLFGQGGGLKVATALQTVLLGEVPLDQTIRQGGDHGIPVVISHPDSNPARVFRSVGLTVLQGLEKQA